MKPHDAPLPQIHLKPGELIVLQEPACVSTILGSCVAVTLYSKRLGLAAVCHALLPRCRRRSYIDDINDILSDDCPHCKETFRYADCSLSMMLAAFAGRGAKPCETEAQLYGGSKMFIAGNKDTRMTVGLQNTLIARKVLADQGLTLCASDVGGPVGRKIVFNTQTGKVTLHRLDKYPDLYRFPLSKEAVDAVAKKNPGSRR